MVGSDAMVGHGGKGESWKVVGNGGNGEQWRELWRTVW